MSPIYTTVFTPLLMAVSLIKVDAEVFFVYPSNYRQRLWQSEKKFALKRIISKSANYLTWGICLWNQHSAASQLVYFCCQMRIRLFFSCAPTVLPAEWQKVRNILRGTWPVKVWSGDSQLVTEMQCWFGLVFFFYYFP